MIRNYNIGYYIINHQSLFQKKSTTRKITILSSPQNLEALVKRRVPIKAI